jgi:peroxiredoxin family protein
MAENTASRMAIIAAHGTLDAAYPPLIIGTTAAALEMEVAIFFTFFGLELLKKGKIDHLQVAPIANPAMPMPVPNIIGMLPGMTAVATMMMNNMMEKENVSKLSELLDAALEMNIRLIACQMTMGVMGVKKEDLIDGIEVGGAATFVEFASHNAVALAF